MKDTLTIRIDNRTSRMLARVARLCRRTQSQVARDALRRQRRRRADARSVVAFVRREAAVAPDVTAGVRVRDPKDVPILAAALASGADVLVTGDLPRAPAQVLQFLRFRGTS